MQCSKLQQEDLGGLTTESESVLCSSHASARPGLRLGSLSPTGSGEFTRAGSVQPSSQ